MIERKLYLEMCQRNSVYSKSEIVEYKGIQYYPQRLLIWFQNGTPKNSAIMDAVIGSSGIQCDLSDVVCLDKGR